MRSKYDQNEVKKDQSGVVYQVNCIDCEKFYIGETGRMIKTRMKEHKDDGENEKEDNKVSGLSQHIREAHHRVDFENFKIINEESNFNKGK